MNLAPTGRHIRWGEATDELARADARPTEYAAPTELWILLAGFYKYVAPLALSNSEASAGAFRSWRGDGAGGGGDVLGDSGESGNGDLPETTPCA